MVKSAMFKYRDEILCSETSCIHRGGKNMICCVCMDFFNPDSNFLK